jgi:hypothetical protein
VAMLLLSEIFTLASNILSKQRRANQKNVDFCCKKKKNSVISGKEKLFPPPDFQSLLNSRLERNHLFPVSVALGPKSEQKLGKSQHKKFNYFRPNLLSEELN